MRRPAEPSLPGSLDLPAGEAFTLTGTIFCTEEASVIPDDFEQSLFSVYEQAVRGRHWTVADHLLAAIESRVPPGEVCDIVAEAYLLLADLRPPTSDLRPPSARRPSCDS